MPYDIQFRFQHLAVPAVSALIAFLSYGSQFFLFPNYGLEPGDLTKTQKWRFNLLVAGIWVAYYRTCTVYPGSVPKGWKAEGGKSASERQRWCRKCECAKPPRTHHCKVCKRCIPKMDHHCPWTANCVSHFTFPHFMRFLIYAVTAMSYLEYFLYIRAASLWNSRSLPSYLGPSVSQIFLLFTLIGTNSITLFAVSIMFFRSAYDAALNQTTIETWEIERHAQLLRRARALGNGSYLPGPDGMKVHIKPQEFPYDVGIWTNLKVAMGSGNVLNWFWVFARTRHDEGVEFETNGFEDAGTSWPPPDPDRMNRLQRTDVEVVQQDNGFTHGGSDYLSPEQELQAFKKRQQEDIRNRREFFGVDDKPSSLQQTAPQVLRRRPFHERFEMGTMRMKDDLELINADDGEQSGEEGWRDSGGSRLKDYGVDEDAEFYDEDEVPLAELIRRKNLKKITEGR